MYNSKSLRKIRMCMLLCQIGLVPYLKSNTNFYDFLVTYMGSTQAPIQWVPGVLTLG